MIKELIKELIQIILCKEIHKTFLVFKVQSIILISNSLTH